MSLNVDLTRIANHETTCFVGEGDARDWTEITRTIGFLTMSTDIGEITEANAEEFYIRACLLCDLYGGNSRDGGVPSIAEIRSHIGLRANVITLTRAKWLAKVKSNSLPNRLRDYKYRLCRAVDAQIAVKPTSTPAADEPRVMVSFGEIAETINRDDLTMEQGLTPAQREDAERRLAVALYELIGSNLDRLASIALTEARNA